MIPAALRGWRIVAVLVVLLTAIVAMAPGPADNTRLAAQPEVWSLPQVGGLAPARAVEALGRASLWGKAVDDAAAPALNDPRWRFLGIVKTGPERFVLIKVEGMAEQRLNVQDMLPGGSQILSIEDDSVCILINGARRKLAIHDTGSQVL